MKKAYFYTLRKALAATFFRLFLPKENNIKLKKSFLLKPSFPRRKAKKNPNSAN